MGLTLTAQVFLDVFKQPMKVILVSVIQFLWMPLAGFLVALAFSISLQKLVSDSSCWVHVPVVIASNVMTFLARMVMFRYLYQQRLIYIIGTHFNAFICCIVCEAAQ